MKFLAFSFAAHALIFSALVWRANFVPVMQTVEEDSLGVALNIRKLETPKKILPRKKTLEAFKRTKPTQQPDLQAQEQNTPRETTRISLKSRAQQSQVHSELQPLFNMLFSEMDKRFYYPRIARKLRQSGDVVLSVEVLRDGVLKNVKLEKACDHSRLNESAVSLLSSIKSLKPLPEKYGQKIVVSFPVDYIL